MHEQVSQISTWQIIGSCAAIVVPVSGVLWYLLKTEMKNQILQLHLTLGEKFTEVESRLSALESQPMTVRKLKDIASLVHTGGQSA